MVKQLFAQKKGSRQVWTKDGKRLVVTKLVMAGNTVVRPVGTAITQLAFGDKKLKNTPSAQRKQLEKAGFTVGKRIFFETASTEELQPGRVIAVQDVLEAGDVVKVTGKTKGRGFAGVVKRHGFAGGPRTRGQSDRERAPGSIGQRTTPGRVFPGMRMAGHMGQVNQTLETMRVVAVDAKNQIVWVNGTLPGGYNSLLTVAKSKSGQPIELNDVSQNLLNLSAETVQPAEEAVAVEETAAPIEEVAAVEETQAPVEETAAPEVEAPQE
jgi:large subunit ribosomal protein L3